MANFISPSEKCPQDKCVEVVQICWYDGKDLTECQPIPAAGFSGRATMTLADAMPIIFALVGIMTIAFVGRIVLRFIRYL